MIISCPNCYKQFKIDNSLITDEGRDLQCGSCDHLWFYKVDEENNKTLKLNEEIINKDIEITTRIKDEKIKEKKQALEKVKTSEKQKKSPTSKNTKKNERSKFFSYLIVFILSFIAVIILLDTLKTPLISVFPELEIILFNLFETLQDIKLFIIDLV